MIKVFISGYQFGEDDWTNEKNTQKLNNKLEDAAFLGFIKSFKRSVGSYKGELEKSFCVTLGKADFSLLRWLGVRFNQEALLVVEVYHGKEYAHLVDCKTGRRYGVSEWLEVTESQALKCDAYSVVEGIHYTTAEELNKIKK